MELILMVEILPPGTSYYDLRSKYKAYEKSGGREYWGVIARTKTIKN
ncbi:MAG: hypothetical protein WC364_09085 [Eubacteriales bacterium]